MTKVLLVVLNLSIIYFLTICSVYAKPEIAFGYMHNEGDDNESDYLETILPNSCANSINAIFDVKILKPINLEQILREKGSILKKSYEFHEIPELIRMIGSDMFVSGSFKTLPDNRIMVMLNISMKGYNEVFRFSNEGRFETQITRLVDKISIVVINFMNEHTQYKVKSILPGTRLAILTNLEGSEENILLSSFMKNKFPVSCFNVNELKTLVSDHYINKFQYVTTGKNSYEIISNPGKIYYTWGPWASEEYRESVKYMREIYKKYDLDYYLIMEKVLNRISALDSKIDVLMIIGFSDDRKQSWVRAVDLKEKEIIWMCSGIKSDLLSFNPILSNSEKIIRTMAEEPVNPFKKQDVPDNLPKARK